MRSNNFKIWTYVTALVFAGAFILNLLAGDDVRLLSTLVLPPLIAGLTTTPTRTAVFTALSITAAFTFGEIHDEIFQTGHSIRAGVIVIVAGLAVVTSILRERDLRSRRRLALVNAAQDELDRSNGPGDSLTSLARAAVRDFADWAFVDTYSPEGTPVNRIVQGRGGADRQSWPPNPCTVPPSATFKEAHLERKVSDTELESLFEDGWNLLPKSQLLSFPVETENGSAVYTLVATNPNPPWGEAELTQVRSLANAAALKARSDELIGSLTETKDELRASRDEISAIVQGIADGVTAQSISGEIIYANERAAELFGFASADELIGTHFGDVHTRMELRDEDGNPFDPMDLPSKRALKGEENPSALLRYMIKSSGEEIWAQVKSTAVRGVDGTAKYAITVIEDLTSHRREELAQRFLGEASKTLSGSLDFASAVEGLARASVPAMSDWCTVEVVDDNHRIVTAAVAAADSHTEEQLLAFRREHDPNDLPNGPAHVIATGKAELYSTLEPTELESQFELDPDRAAAAEALEPRAVIVAPIVVRGETIGAITLTRTRRGTRYTRFDLETAIELGRRAGTTLDNARMHTERMRMLGNLQRSLIPGRLPDFERIDVTASYRPAESASEVGGDFYDAFELPDGSVALVIGDVCGKGTEAASLTALARHTIRTAAMDEPNPAKILRTLNAALRSQVDDGRFCTVAIARVHREDAGSTVQVVSGGHPLPLLISDGAPRPIGRPGTLLGIVEEPDLPSETAHVDANDVVVLYTDGISGGETTDDSAYAAELLGRMTAEGIDPQAGEIEAAAILGHTRKLRDDIAILAAKIR